MPRNITPYFVLPCTIAVATALAQTPDVAQLKAKLQQLDQSMQELKTQIANLEQDAEAAGRGISFSDGCR
jgi:cell division protein FtsB